MEKLGIKSINDRLNILDPWGNRIEIVPYDDCQFTKAANILKGMAVDAPAKTANAIEELKKKGMAAAVNEMRERRADETNRSSPTAPDKTPTSGSEISTPWVGGSSRMAVLADYCGKTEVGLKPVAP